MLSKLYCPFTLIIQIISYWSVYCLRKKPTGQILIETAQNCLATSDLGQING